MLQDTLTVLAATAQHNVVDPVSVVFHGLDVWISLVLAVPYPNDGVTAGRVKPLQVWVILQRVDRRAVKLFHLITDNKRYLEQVWGTIEQVSGHVDTYLKTTTV